MASAQRHCFHESEIAPDGMGCPAFTAAPARCILPPGHLTAALFLAGWAVSPLTAGAWIGNRTARTECRALPSNRFFPSIEVELSKNRQIWQKAGFLRENGQAVCQNTLSVWQTDRSKCHSDRSGFKSERVFCHSTEVVYQNTPVECETTCRKWHSTEVEWQSTSVVW